MDQELLRRVNALKWFHSIDLGNGVITPGVKPLEYLQMEAEQVFAPVKMRGASVIDIGAWNGAHSFNAQRRGAERVLATDEFIWLDPGWQGKLGFDMANAVLGAGVETQQIDVPKISPQTVGTWDVTLFLGVLYHLRSPLDCLERVADITKDCLIVETFTDLKEISRPALAYYPGKTLNNDPSNFFGPNLPFVVEALKEFGFSTFDSYFGEHQRLIVHAWRNTDRRVRGSEPESHTTHPSLVVSGESPLPANVEPNPSAVTIAQGDNSPVTAALRRFKRIFSSD